MLRVLGQSHCVDTLPLSPSPSPSLSLSLSHTHTHTHTHRHGHLSVGTSQQLVAECTINSTSQRNEGALILPSLPMTCGAIRFCLTTSSLIVIPPCSNAVLFIEMATYNSRHFVICKKIIKLYLKYYLYQFFCSHEAS